MKQIKIQLTKEQQDDIKNGAEVVLVPLFEKYKLTESTWYVGFCNRLGESTGTTEHNISKGIYRKNKKDVERLSERRVKSEKLSALACELGVERDFKAEEQSYYIIFDKSCNLYTTTSGRDWNTPGVPYMTKEGANEICGMLNNGEFEL